jgi:hypothetical protein
MSVIIAHFKVNEETRKDIEDGTCYRWNMFVRKVVAGDPDSDYWDHSIWGCDAAQPTQMMIVFRKSLFALVFSANASRRQAHFR